MFKLHTRPRRVTQAVALTLATFIGVLSLPCSAAQMAAQLTVAVNFIPAAAQVPTPVTPIGPVIVPPSVPLSAFCTKNNLPTAHGAVVTVVCSTGVVVGIEPGQSGQPLTPMHGGAYRYVTHVSPNGALLDTVDAFAGAGTTTAWRVVHLTDRDYLEMTLGW